MFRCGTLMEMLRNWMNCANTKAALKIAAHFMSILEPNEEMQKIFTIFLRKIAELNFHQEEAKSIRDYFRRPLKKRENIVENIPTFFKNAGIMFVKMESTRNILPRFEDTSTFFNMMSVLAMFLDRKEFNELLLMRIDYLASNEPMTKVRYELTLAKCGFDGGDAHQINPTTSYHNLEIVDKICKYLHAEITLQPRNLEVAVQIFKNYVNTLECKIDLWLLADLNRLKWLRDWANRESNVKDRNLKEKIIDLFETNKMDISQPTFGTELEVVDEEKVRNYISNI